MVAMVHAAPVQEEQKNLQGLLDVLANQKTTQADSNNIVKQQQLGGDDDGSMPELQGLLKSLANAQQDDDYSANAQKFNWHRFFKGVLGVAHRSYANQQQDGDRSQAEAQFLRSLWATQQQDGDRSQAEAQFLRSLWATQQQDGDRSQAEAQFLRSLWATQQQDDNGYQAKAQFLRKILSLWAKQQNGNEDAANVQFLGFLAKHAFNALKSY